jgi:CheY-like chemotaxis protein
MNNRTVLVLEDDPDDRFITESILEELNYKLSLKFVTHSDELFASLNKGDLPHFILVDYNSKPDNGLQVLHKIRSNDRSKGIPVVILGDSSLSRYVKDCYANGANSVIRKPDTYENTRNKIDLFFQYWMNVVEL